MHISNGAKCIIYKVVLPNKVSAVSNSQLLFDECSQKTSPNVREDCFLVAKASIFSRADQCCSLESNIKEKLEDTFSR
jgi:hypothetical protein